MRSGWLVVVGMIGCAPATPANDPPPAVVNEPLCDVGFLETSYGCHPSVPDDCAPGTRPDLATRACVSFERPACAAGFEADPSGWGCTPIAPDECPVGTTAILGEPTCQPVGWSTCPTGFVAHESGWGCAPIIAAQCDGATRAAVSSPTCVPVAMEHVVIDLARVRRGSWSSATPT